MGFHFQVWWSVLHRGILCSSQGCCPLVPGTLAPSLNMAWKPRPLAFWAGHLCSRLKRFRFLRLEVFHIQTGFISLCSCQGYILISCFRWCQVLTEFRCCILPWSAFYHRLCPILNNWIRDKASISIWSPIYALTLRWKSIGCRYWCSAISFFLNWKNHQLIFKSWWTREFLISCSWVCCKYNIMIGR